MHSVDPRVSEESQQIHSFQTKNSQHSNGKSVFLGLSQQNVNNFSVIFHLVQLTPLTSEYDLSKFSENLKKVSV